MDLKTPTPCKGKVARERRVKVEQHK